VSEHADEHGPEELPESNLRQNLITGHAEPRAAN
jgi:hypothetical protein